jgi:hypothetical protein
MWLYLYAKEVVGGKLPPELHKKADLMSFDDQFKHSKFLKLYRNTRKYQ